MSSIDYNKKTIVESLYYLSMADLDIVDYIPDEKLRKVFLYKLYSERYINSDKTLTHRGIDFLDTNFDEFGYDVKDI